MHRPGTAGSGGACPGTPWGMGVRSEGAGVLAELFMVGSAARPPQLTHVTSGPGWLPSGVKPPPSRWHRAKLWPGQAAGGGAARVIRLHQRNRSSRQDAPLPGCVPSTCPASVWPLGMLQLHPPCRGLDVAQGWWGLAAGMFSDSGAEQQAGGQQG